MPTIPISKSLYLNDSSTPSGTIRITGSPGDIQLSFTPTGGTQQGPWGIQFDLTEGGLAATGISLTVGGTTYTTMSTSSTGRFNNSDNGSGTLSTGDLTATSVSWSTQGGSGDEIRCEQHHHA
jgi:hypothetical protein